MSTVPVPIDAELATIHATLLAAEPPTTATLPALRADDDAETPSLDHLRDDERFEVDELLVTGPAGAPDVPLVVFTPRATSGPTPILFHTHGGGFFSGHHRLGLEAFRGEAARLGAALVSVGYRLAPEHRYPAQLDDVHSGFLWVAANAATFGGDPGRIVTAGTSAGAALTAALSLRLRETGGPAIVGQMLLNPMLDDRSDSFSARQMVGIDIWDAGWNTFAWRSLLGGPQDRREASPQAAPARATDLAGLPPTYVDVGSAETLRDEAIVFATRIWAAGGDAELHVWPGGYHVFDWAAPEATLSRAAWAARRGWLERRLTARS